MAHVGLHTSDNIVATLEPMLTQKSCVWVRTHLCWLTTRYESLRWLCNTLYVLLWPLLGKLMRCMLDRDRSIAIDRWPNPLITIGYFIFTLPPCLIAKVRSLNIGWLVHYKLGRTCKDIGSTSLLARWWETILQPSHPVRKYRHCSFKLVYHALWNTLVCFGLVFHRFRFYDKLIEQLKLIL